MNNKLVLGQYYNSDSWIHRLDPRTKIISIILLIVSLFILRGYKNLIIPFTFTVVIILSSKIPFMKFINSLKMMTMLLFITVLFQVILNRNGNTYKEVYFTLNLLNLVVAFVLVVLYFVIRKYIKFKFLLFLLTFFLIFYFQTTYINQQININSYIIKSYTIKFYNDGITTSIEILLRIITLIFLSSLLTLTTKPTDLNIGLEAVAKPLKYIGVKVSILSMMISIALRFIPTLINEANKILKAQASRGVDFKEGKLKEKVTQIISLLVPMFVISYRRAYDLADAMEARGYIPEGKRTTINLLKFKISDILSLIFTLSVLVSVIYLAVI